MAKRKVMIFAEAAHRGISGYIGWIRQKTPINLEASLGDGRPASGKGAGRLED